MAKRQANTVDKVVEANAVARAQIAPTVDSVWEERIIAQVAAFNRTDDKEFPESAFMVGQVLNEQRISTVKLKKIESACEQLVQSFFKIKHGKNFELFPIFSYIKFTDGIVEAQFNPRLKPYYLELKQQFAVRSLPEFRKLSSVYSQQIYRFLNSWAKLGEATIPLEELHHATNPPPSIRDNYKNFKARVLEIAHKEITTKTSLKYDWEPIKQGKKVTAVKFIFKRGVLA